MKFNVLLIGAGYFAQRIHLKYLKANKNIGNIYIFDERKNLALKVSKKFKIKNFPELKLNEIKKKNISLCVICFNRDKSFYYSKKALTFGLHLLSEKPATYQKNNLNRLIRLSKKKKKFFLVGFQKIYNSNIKYLKQNLNLFEKKFGKVNKVNFELFNGDMRCGTRSFCRTKEKLNRNNIEKLEKVIPSKFSINYKIFLNRYIHSINLLNHLFENKKLSIKLFSAKSLYDYNLVLSNDKTVFTFLFGDYNYDKWHDKLTLFFERGKIIINLNAPLDFKNNAIEIYDGNKKNNKKFNLKNYDIFESQLNYFIKNVKNKNLISNFDKKKYILDYQISQNIWKFQI